MEEYEEAPDEAVLEASRKNPDLFSILVSRYEAAFLRKANSILYSPQDAEEVVQDAFTRMYVYADSYKKVEGANFSSWAYMILTRLCFTRYAKVKKERGRILELSPEHYEKLTDTENFLEELSLKNEVLVALSKLPVAARNLLRFQFLEGKSQEEIAQAEGASVSAIKTRVHRAKKLLREIYPHENT